MTGGKYEVGDHIQVLFRIKEGLYVHDRWIVTRIDSITPTSFAVVPVTGEFPGGAKAMFVPVNERGRIWK